MVQSVKELCAQRQSLMLHVTEGNRDCALNGHVPILIVRASVSVTTKVPERNQDLQERTY